MRTLTSIESARIVNTNLKLSVTPVDQSTTFVFSNWNIQNITPIQYEIDYLGGFGKSSNYQVTLSRDDGLSFWKNNFKSFVKAGVALTVFANSDEFTPHVGVVQDITRFPTDPNLIQLQIFDKFFDNVPQYPTAAIVDSYSVVHPEVSNNNWGYPSYYGKHARPFYMTPVDCDLGTLVGPINVSSENHVTSLYFNRDKSLGNDGNHLIFLNKLWAQQSGSTNLATGGNTFEISDIGIQDSIWRFISETNYRTELTSNAILQFTQNKQIQGIFGVREQTFPLEDQSFLRMSLSFDPRLKIQTTNTVFYNTSVFSTNVTSPIFHQGLIEVSSGNSIATRVIWGVAVNSDVGSTSLGGEPINMGNVYSTAVFQFLYTVSNFIDFPTLDFTCDWLATLKSENYTNYSTFAAQVNCSDIAISENPIHILTDIYSQSALGFVQSQASDTQEILENSGYAFQCFFGERENLTDISQKFGEITGTYIYVGDSGQINFRVYTESDAATTDTVITPKDYQQDTLKVLDNPLGTTVFDTEKAKRIAIGYNYNFTTGQYENSLIADANNSAACNSVAATGINNEVQAQTEYFLEADTASMYLSNILRKRTKDEQIVEMTLPARFYGLELADIIKLEHPILENSESLYQVTKLKADYLRGNVRITANELINL